MDSLRGPATSSSSRACCCCTPASLAARSARRLPGTGSNRPETRREGAGRAPPAADARRSPSGSDGPCRRRVMQHEYHAAPRLTCALSGFTHAKPGARPRPIVRCRYPCLLCLAGKTAADRQTRARLLHDRRATLSTTAPKPDSTFWKIGQFPRCRGSVILPSKARLGECAGKADAPRRDAEQ